ncbi:hypothetical protein E2005C_003 [Pseudomonas phage E2005-C]|uniref:Uncharacterized protein n=1 Tax=Pseudomonas phage vB_PaeM_PE1 TaxID=3161145 RepID=A0AAU8EK28_9CAUD|nr:hypothetical protein E2005C_003 [Pseudomonas phage E2005-C]
MSLLIVIGRLPRTALESFFVPSRYLRLSSVRFGPRTMLFYV